MSIKNMTNRNQRIAWLGAAAQLAFVLAITLNMLGNPELDFTIGFLTGFSIVGNLVFIYTYSRQLKNINTSKGA